MQYYVRELADNRAVLIAEDGYPLSIFSNVDEAVAVCIIDCLIAPLWIEWHRDATVEGIDKDCVQKALSHHFKFRKAQPQQRVAA